MVPEIAGLLATGLENIAFKVEHGMVSVSPQLQSREPFRAASGILEIHILLLDT